MHRRHIDTTTRRQMLTLGLAVAGGTVAISRPLAADSDPAVNSATGQPAPARFTPEAVHYQPAPNDWQKCLYCSYFKAPDTCGILTAPVSRDGWCEKFTLLHE